ncbi:hypothetical protein BGX24_011895 [Mortierella sp. AD032]|nr:hypothetical protein BGX24_011895 [Mortierella sp. AD032]
MSALASPNNPTPSSFGIVSSGTSGPTAIPPSAVLTPGATVPSTSPFSKEVTDHLVGLFFEYSFQDLHFLDPVAFLRGYANGSANPTLLNAICMVAARFSTHPAVLKNPPRMSGEPYAERIRAQIGMLIMDNSIDNVHTLALLSFYEYISGNSLTGYRFEGFAGRMAQELITRNKLEVRRSFPSEEARLTYEVNVRTFSYLLLSDCVSAAISGLPPSLGNTWRNLAIPSDDIEWWAMKGQAGHATMQLDEFSESVLARIRRPRHIRGYGPYEHICSIFQIMPLISKFTNSGAEKGELSQLSGPVNTSLFSSPERRSQYIQLGQQLEQWRDQLPEDYDPWRTRITISRVDANSIGMSTYYFVLQILLHRPILIRATTLVQANQETIHNHNIELEIQNDGGQGRGTGGATNTDYHGEDDEYESDMDDFTDQEEEEEEENKAVDDDRALLRTALETCSLAASEIVGIIEHYSHDWIKYRGNIMSYQVFIASTVLIMILFSSKNPAELARAKQQLETCFHFLEVVTPYWALGGDQLQFLKSLLSGDLSGIMGGGASPATAASGQTTPSTTTPATSDESYSVSTSVHPTGEAASSGSYAKEGSSAIMGEVDRLMASKGLDGASGTSSAFLTTDSGMNTVWLDAESLGAVEEATVLSLNKMNEIRLLIVKQLNPRSLYACIRVNHSFYTSFKSSLWADVKVIRPFGGELNPTLILANAHHIQTIRLLSPLRGEYYTIFFPRLHTLRLEYDGLYESKVYRTEITAQPEQKAEFAKLHPFVNKLVVRHKEEMPAEFWEVVEADWKDLETLQELYFDHLRELSFGDSRTLTSPMVQEILAGCVNLVSLDAHHILVKDIAKALKPWGCSKLSRLVIYIAKQEDDEEEWEGLVFEQISRLRRLQILDLSEDPYCFGLSDQLDPILGLELLNLQLRSLSSRETILDLPVEIFLLTAGHLDIKAILSHIRACRSIFLFFIFCH